VPAPDITGVGQIAVTITDLDAALHFYGEVLGLPLLFTVPEQRMAFLDAGGIRLYLGPGEDGSPEASRPILYWRVGDVEAAHAAVLAAGAPSVAEPHAVHRSGGTELWLAFVRDPDGNPVGLMEERPVTG